MSSPGNQAPAKTWGAKAEGGWHGGGCPTATTFWSSRTETLFNVPGLGIEPTRYRYDALRVTASGGTPAGEPPRPALLARSSIWHRGV